MRRLTAISFLLLPYWVLSQPYDRKVQTGDWNSDGFTDSLIVVRESGSGFASHEATAIDGKSGQSYSLYADYCFCAIRHTHPIPSQLFTSAGSPFLQPLLDALFPPITPASDPLLKWIEQGLANPISLRDSTYFRTAFRSTPQFYPDSLELIKDNYAQIVSGKALSLHRMANTDESYKGISPDQEDSIAVLTFSVSAIQSDLVPVEQWEAGSDWEMWAGKHTLMVRRGNQWAWAFVTDYQLTGSPDKMRWKSIDTVMLLGSFALLKLDLPTSGGSKWFLIDLEYGIYATLAIDYAESAEWVGRSLRFRDEQGDSQTWQLSELIMAIEALR